MSPTTATTVALFSMPRQIRRELEEQVQRVEREHPNWSAAEVERELERRAAVASGQWKDETPILRSRLRQVQRWRTGARGPNAGRSTRSLFPYLWPVGERQRKEVDPGFSASPVVASGSWRVFLYNCGPEVVRDVRILLDRSPLDYTPSILTGRFAEVHWQRVDAIRAQCLAGEGGEVYRHSFRVEFVINRGTRQAYIEGELSLDSLQGWVRFEGRDGRAREIE